MVATVLSDLRPAGLGWCGSVPVRVGFGIIEVRSGVWALLFAWPGRFCLQEPSGLSLGANYGEICASWGTARGESVPLGWGGPQRGLIRLGAQERVFSPQSWEPTGEGSLRRHFCPKVPWYIACVREGAPDARHPPRGPKMFSPKRGFFLPSKSFPYRGRPLPKAPGLPQGNLLDFKGFFLERSLLELGGYFSPKKMGKFLPLGECSWKIFFSG